MFAVVYRDRVIQRFDNQNLAFRFLIAQGWEWDDEAVIRRLPA